MTRQNQIEVFYSNNKSGTYIQFRWPVNSCALDELATYDRALQKQIREEFLPVMEKFDMDFATESSYLIHDDDGNYLVICLNGKTSPELERCLSEAGIRRRDC